MEWDWAFVWQIMPTLIQGVKITILATILGSLLAAVVGMVIAVLRRSSTASSREPPASWRSSSAARHCWCSST